MIHQNLYDAIHTLQRLLDTNQLTAMQRVFVNYILHGDNGWEGFKKLAQSAARASDLDEIRIQLEQELKETPDTHKIYKVRINMNVNT